MNEAKVFVSTGQISGRCRRSGMSITTKHARQLVVLRGRIGSLSKQKLTHLRLPQTLFHLNQPHHQLFPLPTPLTLQVLVPLITKIPPMNNLFLLNALGSRASEFATSLKVVELHQLAHLIPSLLQVCKYLLPSKKLPDRCLRGRELLTG